MAYQKLQAGQAATVTASDTVGIPLPGGAGEKNNGCVLYVGVAGNLRVTTSAGNDVTFVGVQVGFFPVNVIKVWATGTTATDIVALW